MNNNLLFLCLAFGVLILSTVTICVAPLINKVHNHISNWGTLNCRKDKDEYDDKKDTYDKVKKKIEKRKVNDCFAHNVMHDLEYTALIMDVVFGFVCTILGFLHYFDVGKPFEKISGLIGLITGAIIAIMTCIYVGYSASIFNNGVVRDNNSYFPKLYSNKAYLKWKDGKYTPNYDEDKLSDDTEIPYAKYRDLGKKQYNYDSDLYKSSLDSNSEFNNCQIEMLSLITILATPTQKISYTNNANSICEYIWIKELLILNNSVEYKYAYDRWLTTIILSVFIVACGLGVAVFGFLLFKNSGGSSSGHVPVK